PLVELETDKAVVEVPSTTSGVVKQVNVKVGDEAPIGAVLVVVDEGGASEPAKAEAEPAEAQPAEVEPAQAEPVEAQAPAAPQPQAEKPAARGAPAPAASSEDEGRRLVPAAPSVRRLAREL